MRQGPNGRRGRGRPHPGSSNGQGGAQSGAGNQGGNQGGPQGGAPRRSAASLRSQNFDSNGPDVRVRGNAWQVHEKYQSLARDATSAGDRVAAENYLQHAEHYYRIIEAINEATAAEAQQTRGFSHQPGYFAPTTPPAPSGQPDLRGNLAFTPTDAQPVPLEQSGLTAPAAMSQQQQPTNPFFTPAEAEETEEAEDEALQIAPAAAATR